MTELNLDNSRFIFIVGCARSGTSFLFSILNWQKRIFCLNEDNPCLQSRPGFRDWYNGVHLENSPTKGLYLSSFSDPDGDWAYCYDQLLERYDIVGSKYAFGPHGTYFDNKHPQDIFFDFHLKHFELSKYICIIRRPDECVFSMSKMFPSKTYGELRDAWLRSTLVILNTYFRFENSIFMFHQDLSEETMKQLGIFIGRNLFYEKKWIISHGNQNSTLENINPEIIRENSDDVQELLNIYRIIYDAFNHKYLNYEGLTLPHTFLNGCRRKINNLLPPQSKQPVRWLDFF